MTISTEEPPSPPNPSAHPPVFEEEINILDLWYIILRERSLILLIIVLCTAGAAASVLHKERMYGTETLLEFSGGKSNESALSQFGGLASTIGINLGGGGGSMEFVLARLNSKVFRDAFLEENSTRLTDSLDIKNINAIPKHTIVQRRGNFVTLSLRWHHRRKIASLLNLLVEYFNLHEKKRTIQEAKKSIEYLKTELKKTKAVELHQILVRMIEKNIKIITMANMRPDSTFKIIDPAIPPPEDEYVSPQYQRRIVRGFLLGTVLGVSAAFFRTFQQDNRERSS